MIQNLSTRLNSAADANFKSVFGTATVAEEPRDCTVQSASAYKSNGGVARNITVLGLKQICSNVAQPCNDRKTLPLMQFPIVFLALPLLQKNLGTAPFSQHLRINPRVGLLGILLSWVEEGFSAGLFHTRKSREGPRTEQDLEILKVLGPLVPGSKDPEGQGIKSSRT